MIVLLRHDADPEAVRALADGIRELDLEAVPLDTGRGKAFEVVGPDPSRVLELADDPAVEEILTRRTPLLGGEPVWPHVVLRVAIATVLLLFLLAVLTALFPPGLGDQATAARPDAAPAVEWYLKPLDRMLHVLPGGLGGWLVLLFWVVLFLWPFLDRADPTTERGRKTALLVRVVAGVLLLLWALIVLAPQARAEEAASCTMSCHGRETTAFHQDVHASVLGCTDCHGGDPTGVRSKEKSHAASAGFRGAPARAEIPVLCGTCHADVVKMRVYALPADQLTQYRTSNHGIALFERGNEDVAVCTDCHGAHGIMHASDARAPTAAANLPATCGACHSDAKLMSDHGLPHDSVARFEKGAHGRALLVGHSRGAPSCADCHGAHGAAPPGVENVVQVCGRCHVTTKEAFEKSPHFKAADISCDACHGAHETHPGDNCGECHEGDEEAARFIEIMRAGREDLEARMADTLRDLKEGKERGLWFEHEGVYLRESQRTLVSVRDLSHTMDASAIQKHFADGASRQARTAESIRKQGAVLRDRRILLLGLGLLLLLFAALLVAKLRAVRRLS